MVLSCRGSYVGFTEFKHLAKINNFPVYMYNRIIRLNLPKKKKEKKKVVNVNQFLDRCHFDLKDEFKAFYLLASYSSRQRL